MVNRYILELETIKVGSLCQNKLVRFFSTYVLAVVDVLMERVGNDFLT